MMKNMMMKYLKEYNVTTNKQEFVELVLKNYSNIKRKTADRRYYDYQKYKKENKYNNDEKIEPNMLNKLLLKDAKKYGKLITRNFLLKHGFKPFEINWLDEYKQLDEEVDENVND